MSEEWKSDFRIKGLAAPIEKLTQGNIEIIGVPQSIDAILSLKVPTASKNREEAEKYFQSEVIKIIQLHGLVSNHHLEILSSNFSKVSNGGVKELTFTVKVLPSYSDEDRRQNVSIIEKTLKKHAEIHDIFSGKSKFFLRNAIDYYARSIRDTLLEEKLLDLMIALESLFSNEKDELRYRYSLRASSLLSIGQTKYSRLQIYNSIHDLYNKRSVVVHGVKNIELAKSDVFFLQENVREAIKRLLHIEMSKQKIIELLDASILDDSKAKLLNEKVLDAIKGW